MRSPDWPTFKAAMLAAGVHPTAIHGLFCDAKRRWQASHHQQLTSEMRDILEYEYDSFIAARQLMRRNSNDERDCVLDMTFNCYNSRKRRKPVKQPAEMEKTAA